MFRASIEAFKELLDVTFKTNDFMWKNIISDKENQKPKMLRLEWEIIQQQQQLVKEAMLELDPTLRFQSVDPKNLELVHQDILSIWSNRLNSEQQLVQDNLLRQWINLQNQAGRLRTQLKDIYLRT